jgi:endoglucanase
VKNPQVEYAQEAMNKKHQPPIVTGAYGDRTFEDEWFWAATELFVTTQDALYKKQIDAHINDPVTIPSWANVQTLGVYSLLRHKAAGYADISRPKVIAAADELLADIPTNAFGVVMGGKPSDFIWGSSSVAANQGILLIQAYLLTNDKKYLTAAASNVDYLLGKNATGYCFVTGFGSRSVKHPHHRPSVSDGIEEPVSGLLSGGPNANAPWQDTATYLFTEPETTFADSEQSYASNEIAINWNAPAVYLFNAVEAVTK